MYVYSGITGGLKLLVYEALSTSYSYGEVARLERLCANHWAREAGRRSAGGGGGVTL
jgi:hypothetical protein